MKTTCFPRLTFRKSTCAFLVCLLLNLPLIWAGTIQKDLKAAIQALENGKQGPKEVSVLMRYNMEMQRMAFYGDISEKSFQTAQRFYVNETVEILNRAVRNVNAKYHTRLTVSLQKVAPGKVFEPFADIDAIANATKPDEIRYLLDETDSLLKERIRAGGVPVSDSVFLPKANDIDIMADPKRTTRENFEAIADLNNMAYRERDAAIYEAAKRSGGELDLTLTRKYLDEMKSAVKHMDEEIAKKQAELVELLKHNDVNTPGTKEWRRARDLRADIGGCQGKQGKYIERMNEATEIIINQYGLEVTPGMKKGATSSQAEIGKKRWGHNAAESALTSKHANTAVEEAYRRHADVLAELARQKPEKAAEAAEALSKMKDKLNPKHLSELKKRIANLPDREARQLLGSALADTEDEILELVKHRIPTSAKQATASLGDSHYAINRALAEGEYTKAVKELDI